MDLKSLLKRHERVFQSAIIGLIFFFILKILIRNWFELKEFSFRFNYVYLLLSLIFRSLNQLFGALTWHYLTRQLDFNVSLRDSLRIWFYAVPAKYVPGKIWQYAGRMYFYEKLKVPAKKLALAQFMEVLVIVSVNLLFVVTCFLVNKMFLQAFVLSLFGFLVISAKSGQRKTRQTFDHIKGISKIMGMRLLAALIGGFFLYCFIGAFTPVSEADLIYCIGLNNLASLGTVLVFFLPAGLGVREGIFVYGLSHITIKPLAVIISICARMWGIVIELILVLLVLLLTRHRTSHVS